MRQREINKKYYIEANSTGWTIRDLLNLMMVCTEMNTIAMIGIIIICVLGSIINYNVIFVELRGYAQTTYKYIYPMMLRTNQSRPI